MEIFSFFNPYSNLFFRFTNFSIKVMSILELYYEKKKNIRILDAIGSVFSLQENWSWFESKSIHLMWTTSISLRIRWISYLGIPLGIFLLSFSSVDEWKTFLQVFDLFYKNLKYESLPVFMVCKIWINIVELLVNSPKTMISSREIYILFFELNMFIVYIWIVFTLILFKVNTLFLTKHKIFKWIFWILWIIWILIFILFLIPYFSEALHFFNDLKLAEMINPKGVYPIKPVINSFGDFIIQTIGCNPRLEINYKFFFVISIFLMIFFKLWIGLKILLLFIKNLLK